MSGAPLGILLMAYGSAPSLEHEDVARYLSHILEHYRRTQPSAEEIEDLERRYRAVGESPLYRITRRLAENIPERLAGRQLRAYWAMKHSPPFIEEVVGQMAADGLGRGFAVALAPFRSRLSSESYYQQVRESNQRLSRPLEWSFAPDWHLHPRFLALWEELLLQAPASPERVTIFTNHSLPSRILGWQDPYADQFRATAATLAERLGLARWDCAFQSRGGGGQEWLGPELGEVLLGWKRKGEESFLLAPIGFLMDHLETLYDLDIEIRKMARQEGLDIVRTRMPNDGPGMVELLAELIREHLAGS